MHRCLDARRPGCAAGSRRPPPLLTIHKTASLRANLDGCLSKRKLEAAKFVWMDGLIQVVAAGEEGSLLAAAALLRRANGLKEGWGWGVNHGDIALTLSSLDLVLLAESVSSGATEDATEQEAWLAEAHEMLALAQSRQCLLLRL